MTHADTINHRGTVRAPSCGEVRGFGPDARPITLALLNISPHGLMATGTSYAVGARMRVMLPVAGATPAEVLWTEGGRFGCRFDHAIEPACYYQLLAQVVRPDAAGARPCS